MLKYFILFASALTVWGQGVPPQVIYTTTDPTGVACGYSQIRILKATGVMYSCANGVYVAAAAGAANMVVGAGNPNTLGTPCTAPSGSNLSFAWDSTNKAVWFCGETNLWSLVPTTFGTGPFSISAVSGTPRTDVAANRGTCTTDEIFYASDTFVLSQCTAVNATWNTLNPSGSHALIFNTTTKTLQTYDSTGTVGTAVVSIATNPNDGKVINYISPDGVQNRVTVSAASANPNNLKVLGQTASNTTTVGAYCTGGLLVYTYNIAGGTLTTGDTVQVDVRMSKSGTTDAIRYCLAVGSTAITVAVAAAAGDTGAHLRAWIGVTGASAETFIGYNYRSNLVGAGAALTGTLAAAVSGTITINVYAYNANSTDTVRGEHFFVIHNKAN